MLAGCQSSEVLEWNGGPGEEEYLARYKESFYESVGDRITRGTSFAALVAVLQRGEVRVLYLGDHHRDGRLHRRMEGLLDRLAAAGLEVALGLEAIGVGDEADVERYLAGEIDLAELRQACARRWPETWLEDDEVDRGFYRRLLRWAREHGVPVFAIEPTPRLPLHRRDEVIALNIRSAAEHLPGRLLVVVVGQAHLLGTGDLVHRVGLPFRAVGAAPPPRTELPRPLPEGEFLTTPSGLLLFSP